MKRAPKEKGLLAERTIRSMLKAISKELHKEIAVEIKLELLKHQERLSRQLRKVAIAKEQRPA